MTFNENANIDPSRVRRRRGGKIAGASIGGGLGLVAIVLLSQFLGVDLTPLVGGLTGGGVSSSQEESQLEGCTTGAEANASLDCRIAGTADSLDTYWSAALPELGVAYRTVDGVILFEGATGTACGTGTSAMGPFYCPGDETIYMDTAFFGELRSRFGASGGPLAEMYVVAHEWGHHVQHIAGIMDGLDLRDTGPDSDGVRLELQADCFAGAWAGAATEIVDERGVTFLEPLTEAQVRDALSAAAAVGDDHIQESLGGGQVNPETWTHGSSESRQRWFTTGYERGPEACDTFDVPASAL